MSFTGSTRNGGGCFVRAAHEHPCPEIIYHASAREDRQSIETHGLLADPSVIGGRRKHTVQDAAVFAAEDVLNAVVWCRHPHKADVWAITTEGLPVVSDRMTDASWAIECDVPLTHMRLLDEDEQATLLAAARAVHYA